MEMEMGGRAGGGTAHGDGASQCKNETPTDGPTVGNHTVQYGLMIHVRRMTERALSMRANRCEERQLD